MKITAREKLLLYILGGVLLIFLLYTFLYSPKIAEISLSVEGIRAGDAELADIAGKTESLAGVMDNEKPLLAEIKGKGSGILPRLKTENLLNYVAKTASAAGLLLTENTVSGRGLEDISGSGSASPSPAPPSESDEYYSLGKLAADISAMRNGSQSAEGPSAQGESTPVFLEYASVSISFKNAAYSNVQVFIRSLEALKKSVFIESLSMSVSKDSSALNGSMLLKFYCAEKIPGLEDDVMPFTPNISGGKADPFR